ncbi:MAG: efflux RND transporter periplasmic adaptor subunit [Oceanicaulis sp.]
MTDHSARLRQDDARRARDGEDGGDEDGGRSWIGWLQIAAVVAVVIAALLIVRALSGSEDVRDDAPERPAVPVRVTDPILTSHQVDVTVTGTVTVTAFVNLAPQVGGRVIEVSDAVRAGGEFAAGEVLFRIDPRDFEVAVTRARSQLAQARSEFQNAQAEAEVAREEWNNLYPDRPITALAAREPQLEAARSALLAAEAELAQARLDLERAEFSLPFSGRITESRLEVGQLVAPNQSYGTAYDYEAVEIVAPVAPTDLARIDGAEGAPVRVRLEAGGPAFDARVARVGARLDERTRFIDLYIDPGPEGRVLQPGLFADVEIEGPLLDSVMILPAGAVIGLDQVRLVEDGRVVEEQVRILDRPRGRVVAAPFEVHQGLVVSQLPEGAIGRETEIVETVEPPGREIGPESGPFEPGARSGEAGQTADSPAEAAAERGAEADDDEIGPPRDREGARG